jgi:asparaginyl-tRNA synthetase
MVEPEIAYADLDDVIGVAEDFVYTVVQTVLRERRAELESLGRDLSALEQVRKPFCRVTYSAAAELLISEKEAERTAPGTKKWKTEQLAREVIELREELAEREELIRNIPKHMELAANFQWGSDLGGSDETIISRLHDRPVFVTHYPRDCKAFYMKRNEQDHRLVNNLDLLAPQGYGEIIGGSQREDDFDVLMESIHREGLNPADYQWYLDLRRYGSVPHGGFGLGVERTVAWICGLKHIRETIPFARMLGKIYP